MYYEALGKHCAGCMEKIVPAPIHYIRLKIIAKEILLYFRLFSLLLLLQFPLFARFRFIFFHRWKLKKEPHVSLTEEARRESEERKRRKKEVERTRQEKENTNKEIKKKQRKKASKLCLQLVCRSYLRNYRKSTFHDEWAFLICITPVIPLGRQAVLEQSVQHSIS